MLFQNHSKWQCVTLKFLAWPLVVVVVVLLSKTESNQTQLVLLLYGFDMKILGGFT